MDKKAAGFFLRLLAWADERLLFLLPTALIISSIVQSSSLASFFSGIITLLTFLVYFGLIKAAYNIFFTHRFGGVIGKLLTGLEVRQQSGAPLPLNKVVFRQLISYRFSALVFGLGFFSILKDPKGQGWHDKTINSNVFVKKPLLPLGLLALIILLLANLYLIRLSVARFNHGPLGGQIMELVASFKTSAKQPVSTSPQLSEQLKNAYLLLDQQKFDEASKSAQLILQKASTDEERGISYQLLGDIALNQANYLGAQSYYLESTTYSTNLPGVYLGLGVASLHEQNYQKAINFANTATKLDPKNAQGYFVLAQGYYGAGDRNSALFNINKAIGLDSKTTVYQQFLSQLQKSTTPSPPTTTTNPTTPPVSGPGYTIADAQQLVADLNQGDKDNQIMLSDYKGHPAYNQKVVDLYISYIAQRKTIAQQLLDKMSTGETLSQSDQESWGQYKVLGMGENYLIGVLQNGNGGY